MGTITRAVGAVLVAGALLQPVPAPWPGRTAAAAEAEPAATSTGFRIQGSVENPRTYRLRDLRAEPVTSLVVSYSTGTGPVSATFKGVLLWTLLQAAVIKVDPAVRNDLLRRTVRLTAADGYEVVLGAGELAPGSGGEQAIIAYEQDGAPLSLVKGFAQLIMPGDKSGDRNLFALALIEVL